VYSNLQISVHSPVGSCECARMMHYAHGLLCQVSAVCQVLHRALLNVNRVRALDDFQQLTRWSFLRTVSTSSIFFLFKGSAPPSEKCSRLLKLAFSRYK
jgi:hypothetical protein